MTFHRMVTTALLGLIVMVVMDVMASADTTPAALTSERIEELRITFQLDPGTRALMNAITNNDVRDLAYNREVFVKHNDLFNHKIETKGVTNQEQSGRCWLFAGLNILRPALMKKYNLSSFEFSQNHLFFWDKLEKSNMFLEAIIETRKKDIDDRELQTLLENPVPDGGWWSYVVSLIGKYGVVPKSVMPETKNSSNTRMMNAILNRMMRHDAVELRKIAKKGAKESTLRMRKWTMLRDVYHILALHLGIPPKEFIWRYEDKDGNIFEETYTPVSFYEDVVGVDLSEYVSIFDHPAHPYNEYYKIKYCRNMQDIPDMDFINLEIRRLKEYTLNSVLNGEPVWFAADIGKDNDSKNGILEIGVYDYTSLFDVGAELSKAERILYRASTPNHAMVFIGVDTLGGDAVKWLVENSWGTDRGNKGLWSMYDDWFDEYLYTVIIHKRFLPQDVLALLETKPKLLPVWDPMRALLK